MRGWMIVMLLSLPVGAIADGDPKSLAPPPPPPAPVAAAPLPPPAAVTEAPLPQLVVAEPPAAVEPVRAEGFGSDTRYWVATQISGSQAVTEQRPMAGEVAKRTYDRYLKSFEYPIPETFKREGFNNGGGSSTR